MGLSKELEEELEVMKREQEDRFHTVATTKCFEVCCTHDYFPNLTRGQRSCLLNCTEQWLQVAIGVNKVFSTTDLSKVLK